MVISIFKVEWQSHKCLSLKFITELIKKIIPTIFELTLSNFLSLSVDECGLVLINKFDLMPSFCEQANLRGTRKHHGIHDQPWSVFSVFQHSWAKNMTGNPIPGRKSALAPSAFHKPWSVWLGLINCCDFCVRLFARWLFIFFDRFFAPLQSCKTIRVHFLWRPEKNAHS